MSWRAGFLWGELVQRVGKCLLEGGFCSPRSSRSSLASGAVLRGSEFAAFPAAARYQRACEAQQRCGRCGDAEMKAESAA